MTFLALFESHLLAGLAAQTETAATVGQLVTAALITGLVSVVCSLVLARLTFRFVRRAELTKELDNTLTAKSAELEQTLANKEKELQQTLRNEIAAEQYRRLMDLQSRVEQVLVEAAGPLFVAADELKARLNNILNDWGHVQLATDFDNRRHRDWSSTHKYFISSTVYVFARYFAREAMLRNRLGADQPRARNRPLMTALYSASRSLSEFPAPFNDADCPGGDYQVFFWQQRALGEVITSLDSGVVTVMSYADFLKNEDQNSTHIAPLRELLIDLSPIPDGNCRWQRMTSLLRAVDKVTVECRELLDEAER